MGAAAVLGFVCAILLGLVVRPLWRTASAGALLIMAAGAGVLAEASATSFVDRLLELGGFLSAYAVAAIGLVATLKLGRALRASAPNQSEALTRT